MRRTNVKACVLEEMWLSWLIWRRQTKDKLQLLLTLALWAITHSYCCYHSQHQGSPLSLKTDGKSCRNESKNPFISKLWGSAFEKKIIYSAHMAADQCFSSTMQMFMCLTCLASRLFLDVCHGSGMDFPPIYLSVYLCLTFCSIYCFEIWQQRSWDVPRGWVLLTT